MQTNYIELNMQHGKVMLILFLHAIVYHCMLHTVLSFF